jgi:hypothetical protein
MDDFTSKIGAPNMFGLIQGAANAIAPRKRPLSSMTPIIVLENHKVRFVIGSPGGPRIITTVANIFLSASDGGLNIQRRWMLRAFTSNTCPTLFLWNRAFPPKTLQALRAMGYTIKGGDGDDHHWSDGECIAVDPKTGLIQGGQDRSFGKAATHLRQGRRILNLDTDRRVSHPLQRARWAMQSTNSALSRTCFGRASTVEGPDPQRWGSALPGFSKHPLPGKVKRGKEHADTVCIWPTWVGRHLARGPRYEVIESRSASPLPDVAAALDQALDRPIGSKPLSALAAGKKTAAISVCDITRPAPNWLTLPPLLRRCTMQAFR